MEEYSYILKIKSTEPATVEQQFDIIDYISDRLVIGCKSIEIQYLGKKEVNNDD